MNAMLVHTDFFFKLNFLMLVWLNRYDTMREKLYVIITNKTCFTTVLKLIY